MSDIYPVYVSCTSTMVMDVFVLVIVIPPGMALVVILLKTHIVNLPLQCLDSSSYDPHSLGSILVSNL